MTTKPIKTLYVNCLPLGLQVTPASEIFAAVHQDLRDDMQVHHFGVVDFGKGKAMMAIGVREYLKDKMYESVYLDSMNTETREIEQTLIEAASLVVIKV